VGKHPRIGRQRREVFLPRQLVFEGESSRKHDRRSLTGGTGNAEDGRSEDAGRGKGQHAAPDGLPAGGPECHAGLAKALRHGLQALLAGGDDDGQDDEGQGEAAGEHAGVPTLETEVCEKERDDENGAISGASVKTGAVSTKAPSPNKPKTTEGTPARFKMARRTVSRNLPFFAYSLR
jgi:hypothetical protein